MVITTFILYSDIFFLKYEVVKYLEQVLTEVGTFAGRDVSQDVDHAHMSTGPPVA